MNLVSNPVHIEILIPLVASEQEFIRLAVQEALKRFRLKHSDHPRPVQPPTDHPLALSEQVG